MAPDSPALSERVKDVTIKKTPPSLKDALKKLNAITVDDEMQPKHEKLVSFIGNSNSC